MTPLEIVDEDAYHDRTVQDWHRLAFHRDALAIDVDLLGTCRDCRAPLYLLEATAIALRSSRVAYDGEPRVRELLARTRYEHVVREHPYRVELLRSLQGCKVTL